MIVRVFKHNLDVKPGFYAPICSKVDQNIPLLGGNGSHI